MERGRILAIDPGERRVGLAICDPDWIVASPLAVLDRANLPLADILQHVERVVRDEGVVRVLVGYPLNADGTAGRQARRSEHFAERARAVLPVPVDLWDERLTSVTAEERLRAGGRHLKKMRQQGALDAYAAAVLLQDYLDAARLAETRAERLAALATGDVPA